MEDTISINVVIADRPYPMRVKQEEEEKVRSVVKMINEKIKEYQGHFPGRDKQDYLAMCALTLATESKENQSKVLIDDNDFAERLEELHTLLERVVG